MDVGSRLVEKGKVAKQEWKESLRAERERRFDDVCREYAALKVETEQDTYKRMKKEQKRVVKRQHVYTV
ncbi:hypothetical protein QFC21_005568 [Naganishia friedmannii]|uniref:Uncharacterized protein n=1 Tax=Naganishia friedmannii TaxID=89922 RepID=A0ACC2VAP7_9TREE|nr:hypothetical protein QFC21_005568 [Naganishia friedmannii]